MRRKRPGEKVKSHSSRNGNEKKKNWCHTEKQEAAELTKVKYRIAERFGS
jgi:hypothetical protein